MYSYKLPTGSKKPHVAIRRQHQKYLNMNPV